MSSSSSRSTSRSSNLRRRRSPPRPWSAPRACTPSTRRGRGRPSSTAFTTAATSYAWRVSSRRRTATWLFTEQGWSRVSTAVPAAAGAEPPDGARLAYDAASAQVVAVWLSLSPCPPPLENGSGMLPAFMCPLPAMGAPTGTPAAVAPALATDVPGASTVVPGAAPLIPCQPTSCLVAPPRPCIATSFPAVPCGGFAPEVSTWTWSRGRWTAHAQQAAPAGAEDALLAGDANGGLILLTESLPTIPFCVHPAVGCTPTVPAM